MFACSDPAESSAHLPRPTQVTIKNGEITIVPGFKLNAKAQAYLKTTEAELASMLKYELPHSEWHQIWRPLEELFFSRRRHVSSRNANNSSGKKDTQTL